MGLISAINQFKKVGPNVIGSAFFVFITLHCHSSTSLEKMRLFIILLDEIKPFKERNNHLTENSQNIVFSYKKLIILVTNALMFKY